jgi:pyridoxal phosphate enzyme (YggS family)
VAELIRGLRVEAVRAAVAEAQAAIEAACARAGRDPASVELLAAVKYVAVEEIGVLAQAGITVAGENRAQELELKAAAAPELTWDFIGHLQSRKVKQVLPLVRYVHSVASASAVEQLERYGTPETKVFVEINVSGDAAKSGFAPDELHGVLQRCPVAVVGLMTMPPLAADAETSRPWFRKLAELAGEHGLPQLSMGTSQDFAVAVEEGATIVRLGSSLYR